MSSLFSSSVEKPQISTKKTYALHIYRTDTRKDAYANVHIIANQNKIIIEFQCDNNGSKPEVKPLLEIE